MPPLSHTLRTGDRVALIGPNGSGKSSVIKLICGGEIPHTGLCETASRLAISYVPQDTGFLRGDLRDFARERGIDESLFKAILRKLDFSRVQFEKDMASYSAGQKKKVLLSASLCEKAHLHVWDEPMNYIDLYSRMQLEELILRCTPDAALRRARPRLLRQGRHREDRIIRNRGKTEGVPPMP